MGYGDHWRSSLAPVLLAVHSWIMLSPGTTNGNIFPSCPWILFWKTHPGDEFMVPFVHLLVAVLGYS